MEIINYTPGKMKRETLPWVPHLLVATGDWQYGADGFWEEGLRRYLRDCRVEANGAPIIMLTVGDMVDLMSPSNRQKLVSAAMYRRPVEALEDAAERDIEGVYNIIQEELPEAHVAGMLEGHHYFEFGDGTTSDTRLCERLGATFLGDCAIVQFKFQQDKHVSKIVNVWLHHGNGTARPINKLMQQAAGLENVDLLLMGHTPHLETKVLSRMYPTDTGQWKHRDVRVAGTGGWLRSYKLGSHASGRPQGGYAEQGMMSPMPLGGIKVWLKPWRYGNERGVKVEVIT